MSSSTTNRITPKRTIIHYKYKLFLELGLDPYEVPEKVTHDYDTWSEVCQGIFTHLGQSMDKNDDSIRHCGKWYVTNHGRGKILQVVDFYEYEYDSDTEREIQQTENNENEIEETVDKVYEADEEGSSNEEELNNHDTTDSVVTTDDPDDSDDSSEVESLHNLIKNNNMSIGEIKETATKCIDEVISCNIL
jgi:hypothetical protein